MQQSNAAGCWQWVSPGTCSWSLYVVCQEFDSNGWHLLCHYMIQSPEAGSLSVSHNAESTTVPADICDLNSFGQGEVGCFHSMSAVFIMSPKWWHNVSMSKTINQIRTSPQYVRTGNSLVIWTCDSTCVSVSVSMGHVRKYTLWYPRYCMIASTVVMMIVHSTDRKWLVQHILFHSGNVINKGATKY